MLALIDDLHARLTAAGLTVLRPEQRELPLAGAKPGQPGGLAAYLAAHPQGYVQIEAPQGLIGTLGGAAGLWLVQVACAASTPQAADTLAGRVVELAASRAGGQVTAFELTTPPGLRTLTPQAWVSIAIFTGRQAL